MPEVYVKFNSLEEAMAALQGGGSAASAPTPAPTPAPSPAPAPAAAPAPAPAPAAAAPAPAPAPAAPAPAPAAAPAAASAYTEAQVLEAAQKYAQTHGPAACRAKLGELGVKRVSDLQAAQYEQAMQALAV